MMCRYLVDLPTFKTRQTLPQRRNSALINTSICDEFNLIDHGVLRREGVGIDDLVIEEETAKALWFPPASVGRRAKKTPLLCSVLALNM